MKKCLFIIWMSFLCMETYAQMKIASFSLLENDLSALTNKRLDVNQEICALIKIQSTNEILSIEGNVVGDISKRGKETWVYVKPDSKWVNILVQDEKPLTITFQDYGVASVSSKCSYSLEIFSIRNVLNRELDMDVDSLKPWLVTVWALEEYNLGNYDKAVTLFSNAAERGDAEAQYNLGCCYQYGVGVQSNLISAVKWYQYSANQDYKSGIVNLGLCYMNGLGVEVNYEKAYSLFMRASKQNVPLADHNRERCY